MAGMIPGIGAAAVVVEVEVIERDVEDATACTFFSDRVEYMAAVSPAPVAAPAAAIKANVVFDIFARELPQSGCWGGCEGYLFLSVRCCAVHGKERFETFGDLAG